MRVSSVMLMLLLTPPAVDGRGVFFPVGVATRGLRCGVGVLLGEACDNIPMSLGVSFSLGDSKCFAANFRAAGDMLAKRSVFDLKLIRWMVNFEKQPAAKNRFDT